ncbi:uncharacterized protein LOC121654436 isoform X2 [Melanotaenia boesemani]|uniref:uncharacterized protein LOC121654436 isoform X2 n=1 Tax=Melanotaenia boesemani TaxID=1250792 RepID=UPI001C0573C5|nr:uncharacterized protein LOC121654436 isoform X2 [Melanotaenia boesemani]
MLCRVLLLTLMITMMKSDASAEVIIISATSGDGIVLPSGQQSRTVENRGEFRWTHLHLLLNKKTTRCHHGRCELQSDGSLRFSQVQVQDSGNYTLQVFDEAGNMKVKKTFLLQVQDTTTTRGGHVAASPLISCSVLLFLLLVSIITFILRKRRIRAIITSGQTEDNVYVVMRGHHGNKRKQEKDERKEEEPHYVPCRPAAPKEHEDDVYV